MNNSRIPIIETSEDVRLKLNERIERISKDEGLKPLEIALPRLILQDEISLWEISMDPKLEMNIVIKTDRGIHHTTVIPNDPDSPIGKGYMMTHEENGKTWTEPAVQMEMVIDYKLITFINIQYAINYPEDIFDINPVTKKHRIKPRKSYEKGGDEEEFYSTLKGFESHKGTVKGTGLGTPHSHEYGVRGFWRHLTKSNKDVWVRPHQRCIGRGLEAQHEYLIVRQ